MSSVAADAALLLPGARMLVLHLAACCNCSVWCVRTPGALVDQSRVIMSMSPGCQLCRPSGQLAVQPSGDPLDDNLTHAGRVGIFAFFFVLCVGSATRQYI